MPPPQVTIAGGGLAGLTAALRLAERGCGVTLYEEMAMLGGNVATRSLAHGGEIDIYPHMYQGWYENFWTLLADAGRTSGARFDREKSFVNFDSLRQLRKGEFPNFTKITDPYSPATMLVNFNSGVAPPADMLLLGYASLDLLAEPLNPTMRINNMSLTGFLDTRTYMTKDAIEAYETFTTRVWAIPAYLISATDFRTYLAYCYPAADRGYYLTRGPAAETVIGPLEAALRKLGVNIVLNARVAAVECTDGEVSAIQLERTRFDPRTYEWVATGESWSEGVQELLLAVPGPGLARLVRYGERGRRIIDAAPHLADLSLLSSERIATMHVFLEDKLAGLPDEPVGLLGSKLDLAFTDLSHCWSGARGFADRTVLAVSCSQTRKLIGPRPEDDAQAILEEFCEYLNSRGRVIDPGTRWGESEDIDWMLTRYHGNWDARLSLNAIGTEALRPLPHYEKIKNLFFAGDFCQNEFGLTTIEAAVASGLAAARELVKLRGVGEEVTILNPTRWPAEWYLAMRYAWLPAAFAAKAWSLGASHARDAQPHAGEKSLLRYMLTPGLPPRYRPPGD
jgi:phytoene dehydrogenase-like protein